MKKNGKTIHNMKRKRKWNSLVNQDLLHLKRINHPRIKEGKSVKKKLYQGRSTRKDKRRINK